MTLKISLVKIILYLSFLRNFILFLFKVKDAFPLQQEHLRHRASKKVTTQLGEPPIMKSKLRSGSHNKKKKTDK